MDGKIARTSELGKTGDFVVNIGTKAIGVGRSVSFCAASLDGGLDGSLVSSV